MTQLWLIRHGQTAWNLEGRYQGQADPPLNATGWAQAKSLVARLAGVDFQAIYSSDLQRAHDTAAILAESRGMPVHIHTGLREVRLGAWEGMLAGDIQARFADAWLERQRDPLNARPPGGESLSDVAGRVWDAVNEITRMHRKGPLLLVSHGLALAVVTCRAKDVPLEQAYLKIPDNCTPIVVDWPSPKE
jgi:2,3-bisphosphoglycerate-dependent phosphoglycerate mutase